MTEHLFVRDKEAWLKATSKSHLLKKHAKASTYENAYVLPLKALDPDEQTGTAPEGAFKGGVCDSDLNFVAGHIRNLKVLESNYSCFKGYTPRKDEIITKNETVVFGGVLIPHFGHTITDCTVRLWYLVQHPDFDKVVFVRRPQDKSNDYLLFKFIALMGVDIDKVEIIDQPTRFAAVIVPDESFIPFSGYMPEFSLPFRKMRNNVDESPYEKIYLTRSAFVNRDSKGAKAHHIVNESFFEQFFSKRGFEVISPEQYPFETQVSLIAGAKEIVTTVGTLSHLILFARDDAKITLLNRSGIITTQIFINQACNYEPYYIDAANNPLPTDHWRGPFLMMPNQYFKDYLDKTDVEYEEDELDMSKELPNAMLEYLQEWTNVYSLHPEYASIIGNKTLFDVLESLMETFHPDTKFDKKNYLAKTGRDENSFTAHQRIRSLENENRALKKELSSIKNSRSYKVMEPLRKARKHFK